MAHRFRSVLADAALAWRLVVVLAAGLLLAGCRADVYSNLTEHEANQMLAAMMSAGIAADKTNVGGTFTVRVPEDDLPRAIALLNDRGLPASSRDTIGTVFQRSGIISSPFEERVRYIYALGESVAQTLSQIDGVVSSRVHVVIPQEPQLGQPIRPSSAAVFIKHQPNVDLEYFTPQIRRLVSSSIEGLEYAAVTVVLTEAAPTEFLTNASMEQPTVQVLPGVAVRETDLGRFWSFVYVGGGVLAVLLIGLVGLVVVLMRRGRGLGRRKASEEPTSTALMEPS